MIKFVVILSIQVHKSIYLCYPFILSPSLSLSPSPPHSLTKTAIYYIAFCIFHCYIKVMLLYLQVWKKFSLSVIILININICMCENTVFVNTGSSYLSSVNEYLFFACLSFCYYRQCCSKILACLHMHICKSFSKTYPRN